MRHSGTKTIETERLILRRFALTDAEAMYRNWASDPEVTRYLTWPTHSSVGITEEVLGSWIPSYQSDDYYQWAIVLKENGSEPIGSISAVDLDDSVSKVHIGYCLGRAWWRRGIMTEALGAVMDFFFDEVGAERIESRHDTRNPHSGMVMKKCGMRLEGVLRRSDRNNQGICDACWYALLKSERESAKGAYRYVALREVPELKDSAADWFHSKWKVPKEAYLECMDDYLSGRTEYGWYLCLCGDEIAGGLGVIENDFHDRKDLTPNVCAVYTEEAHRRKGIAGRLLDMAVEDLRAKAVSPVYLLTDHTGFYERYGWEFLCMVQGNDPEPSRMYIHR